MKINFRSFTDKEHKIVKTAFWVEARLYKYLLKDEKLNNEQFNLFFLICFSSTEASEKL